jgi:hypothetical protein
MAAQFANLFYKFFNSIHWWDSSKIEDKNTFRDFKFCYLGF